MESRFMTFLKRWNGAFNERQKLQHVYALVAAVIFVAASVTSLVNQHSGRLLLRLTLWALIIFAVNAVVWALLYGYVLSGLKPRSNRR